MVLQNSEIYNYCIKMQKAFQDDNRYFPAKINFIIQYNLKQLLIIAESIQQSLTKIQQQYENDEGKIVGKNEELANIELMELSEMKENVNIKKIKLSELNGIELTSQQMEAILFMVEDD